MALYRVQGNGKAPVGLQVGDEVVTIGGIYGRAQRLHFRQNLIVVSAGLLVAVGNIGRGGLLAL